MQTNNNALVAANQPQQSTLDIFGSIQGFESGQRIAKMFASSNLVPDTFKGDVGGCLIALEMAQRMNANVLQVMQSLYIVHGRPTLSSAFLIASFNQTGRFTAIKYEFEGEEGKDDWGCRAVTTDKVTGEEIKSVKVTIKMAKEEGWYGKKGSKWVTMPELMLRYRAATFLIRTTAPEIALGFQTTEEWRDVIDITDKSQVVGGKPSLDELAVQSLMDDMGVAPAERKEEKKEETTEAEAEPQPQAEATINFPQS